MAAFGLGAKNSEFLTGCIITEQVPFVKFNTMDFKQLPYFCTAPAAASVPAVWRCKRRRAVVRGLRQGIAAATSWALRKLCAANTGRRYLRRLPRPSAALR